VAPAGVPHHVVQRGSYRQQTFFTDADCQSYLRFLARATARRGVRILGFCLMPNHVHLVVIPDFADSLSRGIGEAHGAYSRWLNHRLGRAGHLWHRRFFAAPMDRPHLVEALRYVEVNPVRARLVGRAEEHRWSSARAHLDGVDSLGMLDMRLWPELTSAMDWAAMLRAHNQAARMAERIREATLHGKALGTQQFREDFARIRPGAQPKPRGQPRRRSAAAGAP